MTRRRQKLLSRIAAVLVVAISATLAWANGTITITNDPYFLVPGQTATVEIHGMVGANLRAASLSNTSFIFGPGQGCLTQTCDFNAMPRPLAMGQFLDITCTNADSGSVFGTITVNGDTANDFDMANVTCMPGGGGGEIQLDLMPQPTIDVGAVFRPGMSAPETVHLFNNSSFSVFITHNTPRAEWIVTGCSPNCTIPAGQSVALTATYTPTAVGPQDSSMTFTAMGGASVASIDLTLRGSGKDTRLDVTDPPAPDFELDFGVVPLGTTTRRMTLALDAPNDRMVTIQSSDPRIDPDVDMFTMTPGTMEVFVSCDSQTPTTIDATLMITSTAAVQNTDEVHVLCTVGNTTVDVDPDELDFGEVLVDVRPQGVVEKQVTVRNPGPGAVTLGTPHFDNPRATLSLVAPVPSGPLAAGATATVTVALTPTVEEELDGTRLVIPVDGLELGTAIKGRVVKRAAHIEPMELDLGTVCVGNPVTGTLRLVNDGSTALDVPAPALTGPFSASFTPPVAVFPTTLDEGGVQSMTLTSSVTSGVVEGAVDWDIPDVQPFHVNVRAEYIADGTAISPRELAFGSVDIGETTAARTVTLENCSSTAVELGVERVVSRQGAAAAWIVQPAPETRSLAPAERYTLAVQFAPTQPGSYLADLPVLIDGVRQSVELSGDGAGEIEERTSFYACTCAGTGSALAGWPIALAVGLVASRRRRRR